MHHYIWFVKRFQNVKPFCSVLQSDMILRIFHPFGQVQDGSMDALPSKFSEAKEATGSWKFSTQPAPDSDSGQTSEECVFFFVHYPLNDSACVLILKKRIKASMRYWVCDIMICLNDMFWYIISISCTYIYIYINTIEGISVYLLLDILHHKFLHQTHHTDNPTLQKLFHFEAAPNEEYRILPMGVKKWGRLSCWLIGRCFGL